MSKNMRVIWVGFLLVLCLTGCQTAQQVSPPAAWQQSPKAAESISEQEVLGALQAEPRIVEAAVPTQTEVPLPAKKEEGQKQEQPLPSPKTEEKSQKEADDPKVQEKKCTLSINCAVIFDNLDRLDPEKTELLPEGGVIFPTTEIAFTPGESVFDLLLRTVQQEKIHMEFVSPPGYQSNYIEGIANLYEFDCGELSGWIYKVNGVVPGYGSSRYQVAEGDKIEWCYTCDLGRDVGAAEGVKRP